MEKHRYYYYFDERNDDFANNGIDGRPTPDDFDYLPKNIAYRIIKPLVYYILVNLLFIPACFLTDGMRIHNAKIIRQRKDRKKGYFVFGNHTTWLADAVIQPAVAMPRQVYTVVNPDAISIKYAGKIIRMLGTLPNPSSRYTYLGFIKATKEIYEKGCSIMIYPEAHIWPKYNGVRDFPDVSFNLPAKLGAPCFVKSTVYKRNAKGHTKAEIWYDGPFYANPSLGIKEAQKDLRDRVYAQMCERCKDSQLDCRYHYEKVNSPQEVRTEYR